MHSTNCFILKTGRFWPKMHHGSIGTHCPDGGALPRDAPGQPVPGRLIGGSRPRPFTGHPIGWGEWLALADEEEAEAFDRLRQATRTGRPCGDDAFVEDIETRLGRNVGARKRGRKPKEEEKDDNQLELF